MVSGGQQRDSATQTNVSTLAHTPLPLLKKPWAEFPVRMQQVLVGYPLETEHCVHVHPQTPISFPHWKNTSWRLPSAVLPVDRRTQFVLVYDKFYKFGPAQQSAWGIPGGSAVKNWPAMQKMRVWSLGQKDPLQEGMAIHLSIFARKVPRTEEPSGLRLMQRIGRDWSNWTCNHARTEGHLVLLFASMWAHCVSHLLIFQDMFRK